MDINKLKKIYNKLDLNLLPLFIFMFENGSVTNSAAHFGVSPPSISQSLNKLRLYFSDPLFVRDKQKMVPTALARELYFLIRDDAVKLMIDISNLIKISRKDKIILHSSNYLYARLVADVSEALRWEDSPCGIIHENIFFPTYCESPGSIFCMADIFIDFKPSLKNSLKSVKIIDDELCYICANSHSGLKDVFTSEDVKNGKYNTCNFLDDMEGLYEVANSITDGLSLLKNNSFLSMLMKIESGESVGIIPKWGFEQFRRIFNIKCLESEKKLAPLPVYLHYKRTMASDKRIKKILEYFSLDVSGVI
jgi:DNA-binding transcriptional LysR family regulator